MGEVYLYVKEHSVTKLKYFGKTTRSHVENYDGSGKYWKDHINKHGREHIKTVWCKQFIDENELMEFAVFFSEVFDIVNSKEWANLKIENGKDGGFFLYGDDNPAKRPEIRKKISEALQGHKFGMTGKKHTEKAKQNMQKPKSEQTKQNMKKPKSEEHKNKIAIAAKNRKKKICMYCKKECAPNIIARFHNENCKGKLNA